MVEKVVYLQFPKDTDIQDMLDTVEFEIVHYNEGEAIPEMPFVKGSRYKVTITAEKV